MAAYEAVISNLDEFRRIYKTLREVDARFWHAVKDDKPVARTASHNYRAAIVMRDDDTLYFVFHGVYVIPEDEYRFIEGDVNVSTYRMDMQLYNEYVDAKVESFANDFDPAEAAGVPKVEPEIDLGYKPVPYVNEVMVMQHDERHRKPPETISEPSVATAAKDAKKPARRRRKAQSKPKDNPFAPHKKREVMYHPEKIKPTQAARRRRANKAAKERRLAEEAEKARLKAQMEAAANDFSLVTQPMQAFMVF